jgi:hypothetical protein
MWRRWLLPLLLIALVWLLVAHRTELGAVLRTFRQGAWPWIAAAALIQIAYYVAYAELFRAAFWAVGVAGRLKSLFAVLLASLIVNVVMPSAGAAGAALFVDDAARHGQSRARAAAGVVLSTAADFAALTAVLAVCLLFLAARHELRPTETIGTLVLALLTAGMVGLLLMGMWSPGGLRRTLAGVERAGEAILGALRVPGHRSPWAAHIADELVAVAEALHARPIASVRLLATGLGMHVLDAASLGALFLAFHQPVHLGVLVTGYAFGILAWILSPVAQGIGVVEGVIALVYTSLGVPAEAATAIALAFRGLTFWLPMLIGAVLLRQLQLLRVERS